MHGNTNPGLHARVELVVRADDERALQLGVHAELYEFIFINFLSRYDDDRRNVVGRRKRITLH